jgi:hypothetical protein
MIREGDSFVFQRVTRGLRKPVIQFGLPSGRKVELLGFHLEPGWTFAGEAPRPVAEEVVRRLYPGERPVFVGGLGKANGPAWLCVAYLYSDRPTGKGGSALEYSVLLVCGLVENIDKGIRGVVCELLSQVDWEASAANDVMW